MIFQAKLVIDPKAFGAKLYLLSLLCPTKNANVVP